MTDTADAQARLGGAFAAGMGGESTIQALLEIPVNYTKAADSMAADATSNTKIWVNPHTHPLRVVGARYNPNSTLTAHDSNYATLQVKTDDAAAGTPAVAAALSTTTTDSGDFVASVPESFTLQSTNVNLPAGGAIWFAITKTGSGVVVPAGILAIRLRRV